MKPRLYLEAHITVRPPPDVDWDRFAFWADAFDWKASRFDVDEVDHYDGAWFLSARSQDLEELKNDIRRCRDTLTERGFEVIRAKIEDTLLDTKHGDKL